MFEMDRREFAKGAAGFFGWGMFAGGFGGCRLLSGGSGPKLTFGAISDIHIRLVRRDGKDVFEGEEAFREALVWFRDQGVDGVTISGDLADLGLVEELEAVGRVWRSVFPGDRAPDGRPVARLFVYGNHDWEGFCYHGGDPAKRLFGADFEAHTIRRDLAGAWKRAFGEDYSPVWRKEVKGYVFVGAHWIADRCRWYGETGVPQAPGWFEENGGAIDPAKPFFYLQHPPPKDTCHGPWLWGHDDGRITAALSKYRNAVSLTGHSHMTLTSERAIWQGAFTAIDVGSLSYTGLCFGDLDPFTRENDSNAGNLAGTNAAKIMCRMETHDGHQGMLVRVYDDRVVFERRDFASGEKLGADWSVPVPAADPPPYAFAPRAATSVAPEFPAGAVLSARLTTGRNRGGSGAKPEERRVLEVTIPAADRAGAGRVFDYAVEISGKDGGTDRKYVFAAGFHRSAGTQEAHAPTVLQVDAGLLRARGELLIRAVPRNSFGVSGSALALAFAPLRRAAADFGKISES